MRLFQMKKTELPGHGSLCVSDMELPVELRMDLDECIIEIYLDISRDKEKKLMGALEEDGKMPRPSLSLVNVEYGFVEDTLLTIEKIPVYEIRHSPLLKSDNFQHDFSWLMNNKRTTSTITVAPWAPELIFRIKNSDNLSGMKGHLIFQDGCYIVGQFDLSRTNFLWEYKQSQLIIYLESQTDLDYNVFDILRTSIWYCIGIASSRFPKHRLSFVPPDLLVINLSKPSKHEQNVGLIPMQSMIEFAEKFLGYYLPLPKKDRMKLNTAMMSYMESIRQNTTPEFRIIYLSLAFEVWIGSKLDKRFVKGIFSLPSLWDGRFIVELRNTLIHEGSDITEAITEAISRADNEQDKSDAAITEILKLSDDIVDRAHNVCQFLRSLAEKYLFELIGYKGPDHGVAYSQLRAKNNKS